MDHDHTGRLRNITLVLSDMLLISLSTFISGWVYLGGGFGTVENPIAWFMTCSLSITFLYLYNLYADWKRKSIKRLLLSVSIAVIISYTVLLFLSMIYQSLLNGNGITLMTTLVIQLLLLNCSRSLYWYIGRRTRGKKRVLVLGANDKADYETIFKLLNHSKGWFELNHYIPSYEKESFPYYLSQTDVIVLCPSLSRDEKSEIICTCSRRGIEIMIVPELEELFIHQSSLQQIDDMPVLSINPLGLTSSQRLAKRVFDIMVASVLLIISSPIILVLFFFIPITSKGSALFKQERLGEGEKHYFLYKFRSMVNDAEKQTGPVLASDADPRVTNIGRFIRSTRLDELPQLINVLKGEMSLIGPRPEREYFINQFKNEIPNYSYRMAIKPGLTGLAQILSNYSTTVDNKLRFDLLYIRNYSFLLDMKILFQTVSVVLQREQAGGVKKFEKEIKEQVIASEGEQTNPKSLTQI
ncbi:sugar transferase [Guptibacillus hwajinpoensis]|uniref:sugar transferase n=1 Tax=Guptibacillus hwajinpoensis TaxID=208199 RepID=UPI0024B3684C|nr:sugar transferase [Pseudalkalibacillus hwajinpoensis]